MEYLLHQDWMKFIVVTIAGLLIGLEIKAYRVQTNQSNEIGSVRTYTFIAIMSYIFAKIDINLYIVGYIALSSHFIIYYYHKLKDDHRSGILLFLLTTLVYSFGIIIEHFGIWFLLMLFVSIVMISNLDKKLKNFYKTFKEEEVETFAKLLLLSGVILPLLPHSNIAEFIPVSYFKVWMAVIIVSVFSYIGYIFKNYIFKDKGYLLAGILGGLYSSTATTIVLAKKASIRANIPYIFASSIILATAFMYLRLFGIAFAFNQEIAKSLIIPFSILASISVLISFIYYKKSVKDVVVTKHEITDTNPLELETAILFAFFFILMTVITHYVITTYGGLGLNILSFIVGFTDIDPFVLSILSSKFDVSQNRETTAILIAVGSNNILKALYSYIFSKNKAGILSAIPLVVLGIITIIFGLV